MSSAGTAKKPAPVIRTVVPGNRTIDEIYEEEAREIVDEAIENARRRLSVYAGGARDGEAPDVKDDDEPTIDPETGYEIPNIKWMTADNFTVAGGLEKIEEFIQVRRFKFNNDTEKYKLPLSQWYCDFGVSIPKYPNPGDRKFCVNVFGVDSEKRIPAWLHNTSPLQNTSGML